MNRPDGATRNLQRQALVDGRVEQITGIRPGDAEVAIPLDVVERDAALSNGAERVGDPSLVLLLESRVPDPEVEEIPHQDDGVAALGEPVERLGERGDVRISGVQVNVADERDALRAHWSASGPARNADSKSA